MLLILRAGFTGSHILCCSVKCNNLGIGANALAVMISGSIEGISSNLHSCIMALTFTRDNTVLKNAHFRMSDSTICISCLVRIDRIIAGNPAPEPTSKIRIGCLGK